MTEPVIRIEHARLGEICAAPDEIFHFSGIPGFPEARRFVARQHDRASQFAWLVCADVDDLAFTIADPWNFVADYRPEFAPRDLRAVDFQEGDTLQAVAIARVAPDSVTLNLAAPILLNLRSRLGLQAILESGDHSPRHPVLTQTEEEKREGEVRSNRSPTGKTATEADPAAPRARSE